MNNTISDILNCNLEQSIKKLYLRAKVIELYAFCLQQNLIMGAKSSHQLKPEDIAKIALVKEYIDNNPEIPATISQLAKLAGTNSQYLKVHFKLLNNTTIFNYILAKRMEYGKELILLGELKIAEIACKCGYKQTSHFSKSFKNYFGYLPRMLKGRKNNESGSLMTQGFGSIFTLTFFQYIEEWLLCIYLVERRL